MKFNHSPTLANLNTTVFFFKANSIFNNYLEVRIPSFQGRPFNNPNFITPNEGDVKKSLSFHVNKLLLLLLFFRLKSICSLRLWCFTHHAISSFGISIMVGFVYLLLVYLYVISLLMFYFFK